MGKLLASAALVMALSGCLPSGPEAPTTPTGLTPAGASRVGVTAVQGIFGDVIQLDDEKVAKAGVACAAAVSLAQIWGVGFDTAVDCGLTAELGVASDPASGN